ncbi:MAG TPA: hypothetical protein PKW21_02235 [Rhabdaerophilum sp.]|nr:hypothetical protein [Rhabdaerophilum sp.]
MKHRLVGVFLAAAAILFVAEAGARDLRISAAAGKRTLVSSHAVYDSDTCTFGAVPEGKVVVAPQYGRVEIVEESRVIQGGNCGRIDGWARNVYYTSGRGFRGNDFMRIDFQRNYFSDAPSLISDTDNISVIVR